MYSQEEKLEVHRRVGVTKTVYEILRKQKKKTKQSMQKIVCNTILEKFTNHSHKNI